MAHKSGNTEEFRKKRNFENETLNPPLVVGSVPSFFKPIKNIKKYRIVMVSRD